jgi:hypothetical protein
MVGLVILAAAEAEEVGHVVGDDVEDDVDAVSVAGVDHVFEFLESAEEGFDAVEVCGVVGVIGGVVFIGALFVALDAGDPDGFDAHVFEVGDFLFDSGPVPPWARWRALAAELLFWLYQELPLVPMRLLLFVGLPSKNRSVKS